MRYLNKLFIDGLDAMGEYGIFIERNGYRQLLQMPVFKKIEQTDWPEYDGIEADLDTPILDGMQMQIQFCCTDIMAAAELFAALSDGVYHEFDFREVGMIRVLRMVSNSSFSSLVKLGRLTITFADDFPSRIDGEPYAYGECDVAQRGYLLDGYDFSQLGVYVLDGTDDSMMKSPNVRENLKVTAKNMQGVLYDSDGSVHWKSKDITVKLLINASCIDEYWRRYGALYRILLSPGAHIFMHLPYQPAFRFFYKSNSVSRFEMLACGAVWCEFSLVLTVTSWYEYENA